MNHPIPEPTKDYYLMRGVAIGLLLAFMAFSGFMILNNQHNKVMDCYDIGGVLVDAHPYDICIPRHQQFPVNPEEG